MMRLSMPQIPSWLQFPFDTTLSTNPSGILFTASLDRPIPPERLRGDAVRNPDRRLPNRILRKVCIPRSGLHLAVPEKLPDRRQALPQRQRPRCERMPLTPVSE